MGTQDSTVPWLRRTGLGRIATDGVKSGGGGCSGTRKSRSKKKRATQDGRRRLFEQRAGVCETTAIMSVKRNRWLSSALRIL